MEKSPYIQNWILFGDKSLLMSLDQYAVNNSDLIGLPLYMISDNNTGSISTAFFKISWTRHQSTTAEIIRDWIVIKGWINAYQVASLPFLQWQGFSKSPVLLHLPLINVGVCHVPKCFLHVSDMDWAKAHHSVEYLRRCWYKIVWNIQKSGELSFCSD